MADIEQRILANMVDNKSVIPGGDSTAIFITKNKDYKIELLREEIQYYFSNTVTANSPKYKCTLIFRNSFSNEEVVRIVLNEVGAFIMLDGFEQAVEDSSIFDVSLISNIPSCNDPTKTYELYVNTAYNDHYISSPTRYLHVKEYNHQLRTVIDRLVIEFDDDSLEEFMDLAYFVFIMDIKDTYPLCTYSRTNDFGYSGDFIPTVYLPQ